MTIGGFFMVLFIVIGLYGLFKKDDCTITEKDIDELIHELEEKRKTSINIPQSPDLIEPFLCTGFFLRFPCRFRVPGEPAYVS